MAAKKKRPTPDANILIVEDVYMVRRTIHLMLESAGHKVFEAKDSQEAMDIVKRGKTPDLIILDIAMPGVDGLDFCRVLRAFKDTENTPIVMCTARGEEDTIKLARQNGATDFMVKPVNRATLLAKVTQIFEEFPPLSVRQMKALDEKAEKEGESSSNVDTPSEEKNVSKRKKKKPKKKEGE